MVTRRRVSADAIVDFDHHSDEFNLNELAVNAELRRKCPVAWNERYGGFWFLTSYDAVTRVARDGDTFAHKYEPNAADGVDYQGEMGVPRPEGQPALVLAKSTAPTTKRFGTPWLRFSHRAPSTRCSHSWNNRHTNSSINASATDRWTWCSTSPARSRPS